MFVMSATIRYKDISFLKIYDSTSGDKIVNVIYKRADDDQLESIAPFESLYFRVKPENLDKKFGKDTIDSHLETDFYYDEEGASDEPSKKELDELLSWCELLDSYKEVKSGIIERAKQITTCFNIEDSSESEFRAYYSQFLSGYSYDAIIEQAMKDAYEDVEFISKN